MPLVILSTSKAVDRELRAEIADALPRIVAKALNVPSDKKSRLDHAEVTVWTRKNRKSDKNVKDVDIVILANKYPKRVRILDGARKKIAAKVRELVPSGLCGSVWVRLAQGSFEII